jgi:hypothetical protein
MEWNQAIAPGESGILSPSVSISGTPDPKTLTE